VGLPIRKPVSEQILDSSPARYGAAWAGHLQYLSIEKLLDPVDFGRGTIYTYSINRT
jgi:hypothetical protein